MRTCFLAALLSLAAASVLAYDPPKLRLPDGVRPLSYTAELRLTPGQDPFTGRIAIDIDVQRETPVIWLHANGLEITSARANGTPAAIEKTATDFVGIVPAQPARRGRSTLAIDYKGQLSRTLTDGIFHQQSDGDWYIFTKFEPITARRAFPCFDEPSLKAPWQLTLRIPSELRAFSNTPVAQETANNDGTKSVQFARTKPLPTYLVALAVGPFDVVNVGPMGRKRFPGRIVVPRGRGAEAAFAASVTPKAIQYLESYFGIPYPYEKLDQIVVPITTSWGAMENAGLIAYGQPLLARPGEDTLLRQQGRLSGMVHEMAHQWFGNFVTMAWWDDIWLNEGFASWLESRIVDEWHPDWNVPARSAGSMSAAMLVDAQVSARKVRQPIESPGDIGIAFDGITYMKGASLLGMFEKAVGPDKFRKGIRSYLRRYAWKTATTANLTAELSRAAGQDVSSAFSTFLDQTGVPLLRAELDCSSGQARLKLAQERFRPVGSTAPAGAIWKIPVCYRSSDGTSERRDCVQLNTPAATFPVAGAASCPAWLTVDDHASGYYRTLYEDKTLHRLLATSADPLRSEEKVKLLSDAQALSTGGTLDAGAALRLASRFGVVNDRHVTAAAVRLVSAIGRLVPEGLEPEFQRFVLESFGRRARELGWKPKPGESGQIDLLRGAVVPFVATRGRDQELAREARKLAEAWIADHRTIGRDLAGAVLTTAARYGDRALFQRYLDALRAEKQQSDRILIAGALGAFPDPALVRSALALVVPGTPELDAREVRFVINTQWPETRPEAWRFLRENFDALNAKLPGAREVPFGAVLPFSVTGYCDEASAREVETFFRPRLATMNGGLRNLASALEAIRLCASQKKALDAALRQFLNGRSLSGI